VRPASVDAAVPRAAQERHRPVAGRKQGAQNIAALACVSRRQLFVCNAYANPQKTEITPRNQAYQRSEAVCRKPQTGLPRSATVRKKSKELAVPG
jgi:hypothetical protein